ncbi:MAG: hypothetical protein ACFFCH_07585 [Promethearchaeota archaeon]
MKHSRTAAGLHITCLAISLILMFNGFVLLAPLGFPSLSATSNFLHDSHWFSDSRREFLILDEVAQLPGNQSEVVAQLGWQQQREWVNLNSRTEFSVTFEQGQLCHETLLFTDIHPEPIQLAVEDYNPTNCPFEDYIWTDEESYMSFYINGSEPVRVDGFWIYLRGESQGIFRYRVYGAEPGTQAATFVNTSAPLTDWIEVPISPMLEPGEEYWFWVDANESALVLDPLSTYANTFYFGLGRAFGATTDTRINWVYCRDDVNPDEEDEGDCYGRFSSWSYRTRDLFLNVSFLPESTTLYPTDIDMRVNGKTVSNLGPLSEGCWDSEVYDPPLVFDGDLSRYRVLVDWPDFYQWSINFDVLWEGTFVDSTLVMSTPSSVNLDANWLLTIIVDFPTGIENQSIMCTLPSDWTLKFVHRNTLLYSDWRLEDSLLIISNAEDGLWHLYCMVPVSPLSFYWWIFLLIIVVLALTFLVLLIFYRQQILLPRQRRHRRDLQALADSFYDIHKIRRILLIHKETGLCLLDPIVDRKMRANLVSALIQAITAFGLNLTETEESPDIHHDSSSLQQITYRDFHIIVHDGQYMRNALIFKQPPSSQIGTRLEEFTKRFEGQYQDTLENWVGRLNIFGEAIDLVDEYLFISLRLPHTVHAAHISLSATERDLYGLAKTLTREDGSFTIYALVEKYLQEKGVQRIEVFEALFKLRENGVFVPIQTEIPYEFSNSNSS